MNANLQSIAKALNEAEPLLDEASEEIKHHFYCNKGLLCIYEGDNEKAVVNYKIAINMVGENYDKEPAAHYNLALAYSRMGMAVRAISHILDAYNLFNHCRTNSIALHIDSTLAVNYIRTNQIELALKVLKKALDRANGFDDKTFLGMTLHNLGAAYYQKKDYTKALGYFEEAFTHLEKSDDLYLENYWAKICTLMAMKNRSLCNSLFVKAKKVASKNEHYALLFNSLFHMMTLKELHSVEFIETITLPYLISNYQYSRALYFCNALIEAHTKSSRSKRSLEIKSLKADILEKIIFGGGEL